MQIDWLTVTAQIINFLVLVWLLKRFLYEPINSAMRRRELGIAERMSEAKAAREVAESEAEALKRKSEELEASKEEILAAAQRQAAELRAQLEAEIREEMEEKRHAWHEHLAEEREDFISSLRRQAGQKILQITERVLAEYAESELSEQVVANFTRRLKTLAPQTREKMAAAAARGGAVAIVHTGAAIDGAGKSRVTRAIHDVLSTAIDVEYHEDPTMVLGVRLSIGDQTAEWSAVRYLERLGVELGEIIEAGSRSAASSRAASENQRSGIA